MSQRSTSNPAFTLVELLVVVALIATLSALLMPALGTAKDRAQTAGCASNLQRAGAVFSTFLNDHNGFYPYISAECIPVPKAGFAPCTGPSPTNALNACATLVNGQYISNGNWDPSCPPNPLWPGGFNFSACCANHWAYQLAPYLGAGAANHAKALRCQANPWPWPPTAVANYTALITYRMNGNMFPSTYRGSWGSASACSPGSPNAWQRMVNLSDVDHPSSVMLLGETAYNGNANNLWGQALPCGKTPAISTCYVTNYVTWNPFYCDNHFTPGTGEYAEMQVTPSKSCNAQVAYWHNNSMNALKVDGHVELIPKVTLQAYSIQMMLASVGSPANGANPTLGGIFWGDGKGLVNGSPWYWNQYPGGVWPYNQ